jgi:tripartite ATP-independent transporter DctM subunit
MPLSEKLADTAKYILPVAVIIFLVTGVIVLGVATPTEAAATGALGTMILVACYRKLNWQVLKKSLIGTLDITVMLLMIIASAEIFTNVLAVSNATQGAIKFILSSSLTPIFILIALQLVLLVMGMFMSVMAIILITVPLFMPVVHVLGLDPVWFCVIYLLNMEMAGISPPFGLSLFVMKGIAPPDVSMKDVYSAGLPYLGCDVVVMALMIVFPSIVLWLPSLIRT